MAVAKRKLTKNASNDPIQGANAVIKNLIVDELIFAVVGPAGSGTSWVAEALKDRVRS